MNRRKFPRASYKCTIVIKSVDGVPKIIKAHTENIGLGGICVFLSEDLGLFKKVELEIILEEGGKPINCAGSVVWVVKKMDPMKKKVIAFDTGIEFADIKEADKKRIEVIVNKIVSR